jgi:hypothetical protein
VSGNDPLQDLSATLSSRPGESWWMSGYLSVGFIDSSLDSGAGIFFTAGF